jgi:hypothetical protein
MIQFLLNLALFWAKTPIFSAKIFLKIITSIPDEVERNWISKKFPENNFSSLKTRSTYNVWPLPILYLYF